MRTDSATAAVSCFSALHAPAAPSADPTTWFSSITMRTSSMPLSIATPVLTRSRHRPLTVVSTPCRRTPLPVLKLSSHRPLTASPLPLHCSRPWPVIRNSAPIASITATPTKPLLQTPSPFLTPVPTPDSGESRLKSRSTIASLTLPPVALLVALLLFCRYWYIQLQL